MTREEMVALGRDEVAPKIIEARITGDYEMAEELAVSFAAAVIDRLRVVVSASPGCRCSCRASARAEGEAAGAARERATPLVQYRVKGER
jgi:hypothetical protein